MGQFDWFSAIGATDEAVAVLNDQPVVFWILLVALLSNIGLGLGIWWIHKVTMKPEQMKKKEKKGKPAAKGGKPPAARK
ncbi:hypothetical protein MKZ38_006401 [Zalerion maritima]|uniref:Uncharacterized protein n=1 Tax=Zalerion maritima TaxID=339359 RepID=A0AAD5RJV6_9PEZI|nr:hypothetical protein MKZ38_006401 [Zalerion maritima]